MIDDLCTYYLEIRGRANEEDLNASSPLRLNVEHAGETCTLLSARTDQSGLIGLIRHLHNLGLVLLSLRAQFAAPTGPEKENQPVL